MKAAARIGAGIVFSLCLYFGLLFVIEYANLKEEGCKLSDHEGIQVAVLSGLYSQIESFPLPSWVFIGNGRPLDVLAVSSAVLGKFNKRKIRSCSEMSPISMDDMQIRNAATGETGVLLWVADIVIHDNHLATAHGGVYYHGLASSSFEVTLSKGAKRWRIKTLDLLGES